MTSIVITPFDPEHAEELKAFIENEIDNAGFEGEDMPSAIYIEDVTALKQQRDRLLADLLRIADTLRDHPDANKGNTRVHFALMKAQGAINETKEAA